MKKVGGSQSIPYQIYYELSNTGKNLQGSKRICKWRFGFSDIEHPQDVELSHSITSGKKILKQNGVEITSSQVLFTTEFSHGWQSYGHIIRVEVSTGITTDHTYTLTIDGVKFEELPNKNSIPDNYKNSEPVRTSTSYTAKNPQSKSNAYQNQSKSNNSDAFGETFGSSSTSSAISDTSRNAYNDDTFNNPQVKPNSPSKTTKATKPVAVIDQPVKQINVPVKQKEVDLISNSMEVLDLIGSSNTPSSSLINFDMTQSTPSSSSSSSTTPYHDPFAAKPQGNTHDIANIFTYIPSPPPQLAPANASPSSISVTSPSAPSESWGGGGLVDLDNMSGKPKTFVSQAKKPEQSLNQSLSSLSSTAPKESVMKAPPQPPVGMVQGHHHPMGGQGPMMGAGQGPMMGGPGSMMGAGQGPMMGGQGPMMGGPGSMMGGSPGSMMGAGQGSMMGGPGSMMGAGQGSMMGGPGSMMGGSPGSMMGGPGSMMGGSPGSMMGAGQGSMMGGPGSMMGAGQGPMMGGPGSTMGAGQGPMMGGGPRPIIGGAQSMMGGPGSMMGGGTGPMMGAGPMGGRGIGIQGGSALNGGPSIMGGNSYSTSLNKPTNKNSLDSLDWKKT
eukprot:gene11074-23146_t